MNVIKPKKKIFLNAEMHDYTHASRAKESNIIKQILDLKITQKY